MEELRAGTPAARTTDEKCRRSSWQDEEDLFTANRRLNGFLVQQFSCRASEEEEDLLRRSAGKLLDEDEDGVAALERRGRKVRRDCCTGDAPAGEKKDTCCVGRGVVISHRWKGGGFLIFAREITQWRNVMEKRLCYCLSDWSFTQNSPFPKDIFLLCGARGPYLREAKFHQITDKRNGQNRTNGLPHGQTGRT